MTKAKRVSILLFASFFLIFSLAFHSSAQAVPGDLNGDGVMNRQDAIYLIYHTFLPEQFPFEQNADYNGDGRISDRDAFLLLSGNIGNGGGSEEDDGTGTITPPNGDDVPSLGPIDIPTNSSAAFSVRSHSVQNPLSITLPSDTVYLDESLTVTLDLSQCPNFTSALVQISVPNTLQIKNAKWLAQGDILHFQSSSDLGVIAFEQKSAMSGSIVSFELLGMDVASNEAITVTITYHDEDANEIGSVSAEAHINVSRRLYLIGDVNHDGQVDGVDGQMLLRYLNGWEEDILYPESMDVNEDGTVDSLDALILLRYVNGWDVTLGKG